MNKSVSSSGFPSTIIFRVIVILSITIILFFAKNVLSFAQEATDNAQDNNHHAYVPLISEGTAYYVSPSGSDSNPGTQAQPWRTIAKAIDYAEPGVTIYLRSGVYHEVVTIRQSGSMLRPIRLSAYPGDTPIIDGDNYRPEPGAGLVSLFGDWVEVTGLEVRNSNYSGIGLYGLHDTVSKVFVHHSQKTGVYINGDFGTVQDSRIWRNSMANEYELASSSSSGLASSREYRDGITDYAIMRRNIVWENWGQGIDAYESNQVIMEDNISHDNSGLNIYISNATNVLCQRNFVYMDPNSYVYGVGGNIGIGIADEMDYASANIKIINNIAYNNNLNLYLWKGSNPINNILIANNSFINGIVTGGVMLRGNHQNVKFMNNIVQQDGDLPILIIALDPDLTFSNNLWSKTPPPEAQSPGDIIGNPLLAYTGNPFSPPWYKLSNISPAINHAVSLSEVSVDYFGITRGAPPDIGASEFFPAP